MSGLCIFTNSSTERAIIGDVNTPATAVTAPGRGRLVGVSMNERTAPECGCVTAGKIVRGMCEVHYKRWQYRNPSAGRPAPPSVVPVDEIPGETWRNVAESPRYWVSDHGRVKSTRGAQERLMVPAFDVDGYGTVNVGRTRRIHKLVVDAFIGPRPSGMVIRHLDGNPSNNRLDNLAVGTPSENMQDAIRHGTNQQLRKTHCPQGHPYSDDNLYVTRRGSRACKACHAADSNRRYHQRRAG